MSRRASNTPSVRASDSLSLFVFIPRSSWLAANVRNLERDEEGNNEVPRGRRERRTYHQLTGPTGCLLLLRHSSVRRVFAKIIVPFRHTFVIGNGKAGRCRGHRGVVLRIGGRQRQWMRSSIGSFAVAAVRPCGSAALRLVLLLGVAEGLCGVLSFVFFVDRRARVAGCQRALIDKWSPFVLRGQLNRVRRGC